MLRNYFKLAVRSLFKNKSSSLINISGLAAGMAVAILIGLWIFDELSFNRSFEHYDRLAKVWQFVRFGDGDKSSYDVMPAPLAPELRNQYPDFEAVSMSSHTQETVVAIGGEQFSKGGNYVEPSFPSMLSLRMLSGDRNGLRDINSILLSRSLAASLFGRGEALHQVITLNNKMPVKVAGVYEDFGGNTQFAGVEFLAPWDLYVANDNFVKAAVKDWDNNNYQLFVQVKPGIDMVALSTKIRDIRMKREDPPAYKPEFFLHPMSKWHLYSSFKNGVNDGGTIRFVWLFGIIGVFVLLLACINFMNLSTARSEKRAREVGIRKAIGSERRQLIVQFLTESLLVVGVALILALLLVQVSLPFFNIVSGKELSILWPQPLFWGLLLAFSLITGLVAGSYPAFYLSSFKPVKVLKGVFRAGRFAALPRKALVTFQFTVSVALIICTIIVFRQIEHARTRPLGYSQEGLIEVNINTTDLRRNLGPLRTDLMASGAVVDMAGASCGITSQDGGTTDFFWEGKNRNNTPLVMSNNVTYDFGKTIGWKLAQGRDFSRAYGSDSAAIILNEAAVKLIAYKQPLGAFVKSGGKEYKIIGVVKDMVRESPFTPVQPTFFKLGKGVAVIDIRLTPAMTASESLEKVAKVFKTYNPGAPFQYTFVDERFGKKFGHEERIGKLASFFAVLAIFISCLGLFGLSSFIAEKRTKEIGVRKVLGASVLQLWGLLSKEFVVLVGLSLLIALPLAYYFMSDWLGNYEYRASLSWWIFAVTALGALAITLMTVSVQAIKAALMNPVKSLRSE
ncbi:ABC transporter permease [Paraflavitalea sp. CAU 1676]|uniref:ABC transporter permease n=1 Tax=Paraflavitalea sp. CAU 1676 TaxID=3032598 RepID=UPI0023D9D6DF|nr:ABC transporter permease [Paraflavitalea sp. CAU 1676]MDF2189093.1 ABC transporter permease [Paraflavitalea sp. CAU 1676]